MSLPRPAAGRESCKQDSFLPYRKVLRQKMKCRRHFFMCSPVQAPLLPDASDMADGYDNGRQGGERQQMPSLPKIMIFLYICLSYFLSSIYFISS